MLLDKKYRFIAVLGEGAMCTVFKALHVSLERYEAIKVPKPVVYESAGGLERFFQEARFAARLEHPNIVRIYEVNREFEEPYISMEYIDGGDLLQHLKKKPSLHSVLEMTADVARALEVAHRAGIIHRDLKPANILVSSEGKAKVADWGLSRAISRDKASKLTASGAIVGTLLYMAPEQLARKKLGPWSDIYSLGVILYEVVLWLRTGEKDVHGRLAAHLQDELPHLDRVVSGLPRGLGDLVREMLMSDPARRPPSAAAVSDLLGSILENARSGIGATRRKGATVRRAAAGRRA